MHWCTAMERKGCMYQTLRMSVMVIWWTKLERVYYNRKGQNYTKTEWAVSLQNTLESGPWFQPSELSSLTDLYLLQGRYKLLAMENTPQSLPSCYFGLFTMVTWKGLVWQPNHLWIVWYVPSSRDVYTQSNTLTSPGTPCIVVATIQWSTQEWMTCSMHALALKPCEWDWYKIDCNPSRFRNCNRNTVWT